MREILLDTHIFLWLAYEPQRLSANLRRLLDREDVRWHISQISVWEIQVKYDLGKLPLSASPGAIFPGLLEESGLAFHTLSNEAIFMLGKLPNIHRDPFDRLLIATALCAGWEIATVDPQISRYPVRVIA